MRYLKNFESLNTNSYYREIDESEFYSTPDTKYCCNISELTKEYYKKICSASDVGRGETYEVYSNMFAKKVTFSEMATNIVHKHNIDGHIMSDGRFWLNIGGCIVENKDEWFYVFLNNYKIKETIYLCDQLEGLDKFLGDIKL